MQKELNEPLIEKSKPKSWEGMLYMNIFAIAISVYSVFAKIALGLGLDEVQLNMLRSLVCAFLAFGIMVYRGKRAWSDLQPHNRVPLAIRSVCGQTAFLLTILSMKLLPLSTIYVIFNLNAFFASFFSFLINKEPILKVEIFSMLVCFTAVYMLAQIKQEEEQVA